MPATGTDQTRLVILRGNSGSGKSTTARELRARLGRGVAWVEQDYLRRIVLREHDVPGGANIGLIEQTVRYALDQYYDVVLEGTLNPWHYGDMLRRIIGEHAGTTLCYFFDLTLDETLRRHATRPLAREVTPDELRAWYRGRDLLRFVEERILTAEDTLHRTVERILADLPGRTPFHGRVGSDLGDPTGALTVREADDEAKIACPEVCARRHSSG